VTTALPPSCAAAVRASTWHQAATLCQSEADRGSLGATRLLASLYQQGNGVERSDSTAAFWYRRAAERGDPNSAFQLGLLLAATPGGPQREIEATTFLRQAADADVREAWPVLAERYEQGLGTRRNDQEAAFWYRKAAEQGNRAAQYNLAGMYARGRGVVKSDAEAAGWYQRAAEQGHVVAQYELGMAYVRGRGVAKSDSVGMVWLQRAAGQGHAESVKEVERRKRP
jgi:TPR repeat protein